MKFLDFNLTIRMAGDRWLATFADPDIGVIDEWISMPPPAHEIEALRDKVEKDAQTTALKTLEIEQAFARGAATEADEKLKDLGQKLFNWVFSGRVLQAFKDKHSQARIAQHGLRIRVSIDPGDSSLGSYPFETMFCSDLPFKDHLALFGGVTIVRSLAGYRFRNPAPIMPPLSILIVGASPRNLPRLNVGREIENLKRALSLPGIKVETLEDCSIERLMNSAAFEKAHVLHFIGHGEFDRESKEGKIFLVNRNGDEEAVTGGDLRRVLANISSLRLVTLNTCQGNASEGADLFSSVATSIFSLQIPAAVVAMQFRITDLAAVEFSRCFYSQLALGRPVDDAVTTARAHVRRKIQGSPEWATPVLYLGTTDGDFLGLRLPFEQLSSHSLSQLREGNWDLAKSTAMLAQEQHPEADAPLIRKVITLADKCEQFSETQLQVFKLLKRGSGDYPGPALEKLVAQAMTFQVQEFEQTLAADLGKCQEILYLAQVIIAFGSGDFDQVIKLCAESPAPDSFDFSLIEDQAGAEREAQKELKTLEELWSSGEWEVVSGTLQTSPLHEGFRRTRAQQKIEAMRYVGKVFRRATEALTRNDFKRAQSIMAEVSSADAPGDFEFCRRAIDIGVKAAEYKDAAGLSVVKQEMEELLAEFDEASIPETVLQVENFLAEIGSEMDYQSALDLYAAGYFTESQEIFVRLGAYKDSEEKVARCEKWIVVIQTLKSRQWDDAKRLLDSLRTEDKSSRVLSYRRWCNWARTVIPVLETMAASSLVYDPLVPWEGGDNPYKIFAGLGISPTSKLEQCSDLGFELRVRDERNAWDTLRLLNRRLPLDVLLYTVRNQELARGLVERLCNVEEGKEKELRPSLRRNSSLSLRRTAGYFWFSGKTTIKQSLSFCKRLLLVHTMPPTCTTWLSPRRPRFICLKSRAAMTINSHKHGSIRFVAGPPSLQTIPSGTIGGRLEDVFMKPLLVASK